jgi:hypothetical protein
MMPNEHGENGVSREVLAVFDAMWGLHPSPVMLIKANRDIVAVNERMKKLGVSPGIKCFQLTGKDRICKGCRGNEALKEGKGKREGAWQAQLNMFADTYWSPVKGRKDLYVHFGNDITPFVKEELRGPHQPAAADQRIDNTK